MADCIDYCESLKMDSFDAYNVDDIVFASKQACADILKSKLTGIYGILRLKFNRWQGCSYVDLHTYQQCHI